MRIQLLSDLHLERNDAFVPEPAPGADVLVLAGDIGSYQRGSRLAAAGDADFGLGRFAGWPVPVLYVPGNHEYDLGDLDATRAHLRATCERLGLTWLDREVVPVAGMRFIGTTLWSDFDAVLPRHPDASAAEVTDARERALRAADRFLAHAGITQRGQPFAARHMRALALDCRAWLERALAQPFDGPTVVVTHYAPSLRSGDPRYPVQPVSAAFCSAADDLLPRADLWLHGHVHAPQDWRAGRCRVVANPLGYAEAGEQAAFVAQWVVAVPPPASDAAAGKLGGPSLPI